MLLQSISSANNQLFFLLPLCMQSYSAIAKLFSAFCIILIICALGRRKLTLQYDKNLLHTSFQPSMELLKTLCFHFHRTGPNTLSAMEEWVVNQEGIKTVSQFLLKQGIKATIAKLCYHRAWFSKDFFLQCWLLEIQATVTTGTIPVSKAERIPRPQL